MKNSQLTSNLLSGIQNTQKQTQRKAAAPLVPQLWHSAEDQYQHSSIISQIPCKFKIINNDIDCSQILELFKLNAPPRNLRKFPFFHLSHHTSVFGENNSIDRLCNLANKFCHAVDFFSNTNVSFKNQLLTFMRSNSV